MNLNKGIFAAILFFIFGRNLLAVEYRYEDLMREEYEYKGSGIGDYDVLSNDEIVYMKGINYDSKAKRYDGTPEKNKIVIQICRRKIGDEASERMLFEFEYIYFYSTEDYKEHRVYKDEKLKGASAIRGIDVCWKTGQIAFALENDEYYLDYAKGIQGGIYVMDFEGKNLRCLVPCKDIREPIWNKEGMKIIFRKSLRTDQASMLFQKTGHDEGIFLYDLEKDKYTFITEHNSEAVWTPDGNGILFEFRLKQGGQEITHRINIDGTGLEKTIHPWLVLQSPDGRYWAGVRGVVLEGSIEENRRTVYRPKVDYFRKWFPDSKRLLGVSGESEIIIVDIRDGSVSSAFGNNIDQKGGRA